MVASLQIRGAEQLERLSRVLRQTGAKDLRSELFRGINRAAKPLKETARTSPTASPGLPRRGGLANLVQGNLRGRGVKTKTRASGRSPGVRITGESSGHDIRAMNRGRLRHPTHGRPPWVNQSITSGFWDKPIEADAPAARDEMVKVIEEIADKIVKRVG